MKYLSTGFWKFGHDCKWDVLVEPQHTHLIYRALKDRETTIEQNPDGSYTFYGRQEALLIYPSILSTRLLLCFYSFITNSV